MEFIFGFIAFFLASYVSFYLPGKLMLSRIFHSLSDGQVAFISWPVGLAIFLMGIYLSSWIHLPFLYLAILLGVVLYALIKDRELFHIKMERIDLWSVGIILLGSLTFLSLTAFSYLSTKNGIQFIGSINIIDGLLHIAYTKALLNTFPPVHAGLAEISLRGYHYFYDLLMSRFVLFYHFKPEDLYYRYFSLGISLLYGGAFYFLTTGITNNKFSQRLVLFFAYFAQSSALVYSFFVRSISPTAEMGSIYPLELILNPAIVLSIGMLLSFTYLLFNTKPKFSHLIFIGFLFGMITELKVYTGIIGIFVLGIVLLFRIVKKRHNIAPYFFGFITTIFVILITYIPNNFGAGALWFSPFFAYSVFMQEPPFAGTHWELQRIIFRDHRNIPHLTVLYLEAIGFFWLSTLGSRLFILLGLPYLFKFSFWKNEKVLAITGSIVVPILIGSLFVQSISIFDTKQFFWIAGALIAIPTGLVLGQIFYPKNIFVKVLLIGVLFFLSFGGIWGLLQSFIFHPVVNIITKEDIDFFTRISREIPQNSFIVYLTQKESNSVINSSSFLLSPTVSAFTGHQTYYEPESAQFDLKSIYEKRKNNLNVLNQLTLSCEKDEISNLLNKIGSRYVLTSQKISCFNSLSQQTFSSKTGLTLYSIKL